MVADRIVEAVAAGHLLPSQRLVEQEMADRLAVSRVPLREAMKALCAQGILVTEPVTVEVGGLSGLMIDVTMDPASDASCTVPDFPGRIVPLIVGTGPAELDHAQIDGITTRLYLLDSPMLNMVIEISDVAASRGTLAESQAIVDTFQFDAG